MECDDIYESSSPRRYQYEEGKAMKSTCVMVSVLIAFCGCGDEEKEACNSDDQCPGGQYCSYGSCLSDCVSHDDCRSGYRCDTRLGKCYAHKVYTYYGCSVQCTKDNDCKNYKNAKCIGGSCRVFGCTNDSDCTNGEKCYTVNHMIGYKIGACCWSKNCEYETTKCSSDYSCTMLKMNAPGWGGSRCDKNSGFCYCVNNNDCTSYSVESKCVRM